MKACCRAVIKRYRKAWGRPVERAALCCSRSHRVARHGGTWIVTTQQEAVMKKSDKKAQPKKISIADAFKMWLGGKGRSELADQTGLTRGELRKAFVKSSGKSWSELNV